MSKKNVHVVPPRNSRAVKKEGNNRASSIDDTQQQDNDAAIPIAQERREALSSSIGTMAVSATRIAMAMKRHQAIAQLRPKPSSSPASAIWRTEK